MDRAAAMQLDDEVEPQTQESPEERRRANEAISEYLSRYCHSNEMMNYAVLLRGPWGAGKTHFIKYFLETNKVEHIYISINGLSSTGQIDDEFFRILHPWLGSKTARFATAVAKGLLKATIKIDLDEDGRQSASVNPGVPDADIKDLMAKFDRKVLVFDDLERCKIPVQELMGYINSYVEANGCKCILVANELELTERSPEFKREKDKYVGKTFEVRASEDAAYDAFCLLIKNDIAQGLLTQQKAAVLETYRMSDAQNLRLLKQALWDASFLLEHMTDAQRARGESIRDLTKILIATSIESRGDIGEDGLRKLFRDRMKRLGLVLSFHWPRGSNSDSRCQTAELGSWVATISPTSSGASSNL